MNEDLISNNFVDNTNKVTVKKTFVLTRAVLYLSMVYAMVDLLNWYVAITSSLKYELRSDAVFYTFRIQPLVAVIILSCSIISASYIVKGNKMIDLAFDNSDADFFNSGYTYFYKAARISMIAVCIAIISVGTRLLLK